MNISYNWLKQYVDIDLNPTDLGVVLTNIGLEVSAIEKWQSVKGGLEGLLTGEVKTCGRHPNADKLSVTTVDVGTGELLPIVCGAPNVAAGQKVVVATVGTTLTIGKDTITIKEAKIRGEISKGMICAQDEIGLGDDHSGIVVLSPDAPIGMKAADYFGVENDHVFEIGLTPNRIDGASHIGTARDLVAFFNHQNFNTNASIAVVNRPSVDNFAVDNHDFPIEVKIESPEACHRYCGVTIAGVTIEESPIWLQNRLRAIGMNPINNVVDITNFVLHETGQPLHAFDADMITGNEVLVKMLPNSSKFVTLDGVERTLTGEDLMICNSEEGMCIAGVFGGIHSGVTEDTFNIFLESANFDPVYIRRTSKRHGLNTDSSFRFERGADPNINLYALKRAALLIKEIAGGTIASDVVDVYPNPIQDCKIDVTYHNIARLIGKKIDAPVIKNILLNLDIQIISETVDGLSLQIPAYRVDVKREVDVIEEILRIYGYNNVEIPSAVNASLSYSPKPDVDKLRNRVSDMLTSNGFNEIMSNSLTKSGYYEKSSSLSINNNVKILNPISSDLSVLRQTLLFSGLEAISFNRNRRNADLKLYEFGNCYFYKSEKGLSLVKDYSEEEHLSLLMTGNHNDINWYSPEKQSDFYQLKAALEMVLKSLRYNCDTLETNELEDEFFSYGLQYSIKGIVLVRAGAIALKWLKEFDIDSPVFYADFNWSRLVENQPAVSLYAEIPKFPEVRRDLALLLDKDVKFKQIRDIAFKNGEKLLKKVTLFDVFEGEKLGANKKSYAVNYVLQDETMTLTDKQIDKVMTKLIKAYEREVGAQIR